MARAAFGQRIIQYHANTNLEETIKKTFTDAKRYQSIELISHAQYDELRRSMTLNGSKIREVIKRSREKIKSINIAWIDQLTDPDMALREKMTLFWHDHFACRSNNAYFVQKQNNTIRKHALGKFGDLLTAVSQDAAMLQFLNNQQNRKSQPNENFARELLELFTLGRGHYTEPDIKEAARALTGWGFNLQGEFVFRKRVHDYGQKTFLGRKGNFDGEDILSIILEEKQTARFLTEKIYQYFVNDQIDPEITEVLAMRFYDSGYNIELLLKEIFTSAWFYDPGNVGNKIKSPVDFIAGLMVNFDLQFEDPEAVLFLQRAFGQVLFYPPNVGGWPTGKAWIDSSSLAFRLRLPEFIIRMSSFRFNKSDEDLGDLSNFRKETKRLRSKIDWKQFGESFSGTTNGKLISDCADYLLNVPLEDTNMKFIEEYLNSIGDAYDPVKEVMLSIASLPEYQLC
ncbi:DUF1800 domain-containing protein [Fulvivirgaceae bacterium BMA10]|uniref:DUF1800 domain-containing protein n=1 Tax=Splendidivirga corallicola TaxID=3051826 RepID=A0ABT8KS52_9BACT|nr:DUF1800 domain-containing protein [Fulvivirgaceae bacterium BMA10]